MMRDTFESRCKVGRKGMGKREDLPAFVFEFKQKLLQASRVAAWWVLKTYLEEAAAQWPPSSIH